MARRARRPVAPDRSEYRGEPGGAPPAPITWEELVRRLSEERYYWLVTVRRDGLPHAVAVWAVWFDDALWFATNPRTATGRNLARRPYSLVHLESGREVAIVEGPTVRPEPVAVPSSVIDTYEAKYGWRLDPNDEGMPLFTLRPRLARTWRAEDVRGSAIVWTFD